MKKNTKILLGVGAVAVLGYYVWKQNQKPKIFASAVGDVGSDYQSCKASCKNAQSIYNCVTNCMKKKGHGARI